MIDKIARSRARRLLKRVALGKITNFECENEFYDLFPRSSDPVIFALFRTVWGMSGDSECSLAPLFLRGSELRKRLCRWIVFLKTDLEYEWPKERLSPGLRDICPPTWFDRLLGMISPTTWATREFCSLGNHKVWPFLREADFNAARLACAERQRSAA